MEQIVLFILIAIVTFVLQTVFRGKEDPKQGPRGPNQPRPKPARPKRPTTDLDRFLEETRKQKQAEERKPVATASSSPTSEPDRAEETERERRAASSPKPQKPERRPPPRPAPPVKPRREEEPVMMEIAPVEPRRAALPSLPVHLTSREELDAARIAVPKNMTRPGSELLTEALALMRRPQGIAVALVLREILDPPVSLRRRPSDTGPNR